MKLKKFSSSDDPFGCKTDKGEKVEYDADDGEGFNFTCVNGCIKVYSVSIL